MLWSWLGEGLIKRGVVLIRGMLLSGVFAIGVVIAPALHAGASPAPATMSATAPQALTAPVPLNTSGCYWTNCTQAHQNGEGDIPQGSAHYCSKQDRDGDGVACEW